jgi:hypothetical protein
MRRLSHTTCPSSAKQHRVNATRHQQPAMTASTTEHAPPSKRQRPTTRPRRPWKQTTGTILLAVTAQPSAHAAGGS